MTTLRVAVVEQLAVLEPGDTMTLALGESAGGDPANESGADQQCCELPIGLAFRAGWWWVQNLAEQDYLQVLSSPARYQVAAGPGEAVPLLHIRARVRYFRGRTVSLVQSNSGAANLPVKDEPISPGKLPGNGLTLSQKLLVLVLAEHTLRYGWLAADRGLPSSLACAQRLGWPLTTFNRKLDNVCQKLSDAGVVGLRGGVSAQASTRRMRLMEYAVSTGVVTRSDLALLDDQVQQAKMRRISELHFLSSRRGQAELFSGVKMLKTGR